MKIAIVGSRSFPQIQKQRKQIAKKAVQTRWAKAKGKPIPEPEQVSVSLEQEKVKASPTNPISLYTVLSRPPALIGETTIYAKVIRVGGQKPKVEVETVNGDTLFCEASIDITTKLGTRLYQIVGLVGTAIWDSELNNIEQFSIKDVTEYANTSIKEAMNELSRLTKEYYSNIDDVEEYISEIRGSN